MHTLAVLVIVLAAGCSGDRDRAPADADPDASEAAIRFSLKRAEVGERVATTAVELVEPPTVLDGIAMTEVEPGVWSTNVPSDTPVVSVVRFKLAGVEQLWTLPTRDGRGLIVARNQRVNPAPAGARLDLSITLPEPYDQARPQDFAVQVLGTGFEYPVNSPSHGATTLDVDIPYEAAPGITMTDTLVVLRYDLVARRLSGVFAATPFDQIATTTTISGALQTVSADHPLGFTLDLVALGDRFEALTPAWSSGGIPFEVIAAPGGAIGSTDGHQLASGVSDLQQQYALSYGNPFEAGGWPVVASGRMNTSRLSVGLTANKPATLRAGLELVASADHVLASDFQVGLPAIISVNQQPLTADLLAFPKGFEVTFTTDLPEDDTFYTLTLSNLRERDPSGGGGGGIESLTIARFRSTTPHFVVPADLFRPGASPWYTLRVSCTRGGHINARTGDFETFALPVATSSVDSPVIVVQ